MPMESSSKVRVQTKTPDSSLNDPSYFGFHPPRPLIHPPNQVGDAIQRGFLFVPGTIYCCTNPQNAILHKLLCGNMLISLAFMIP